VAVKTGGIPGNRQKSVPLAGLEVTVAERAEAPLIGALGGVIGKIAAEMQRDHGVDLHLGVSVEALEGDAAGHVRRARLSDKTTIDVDVVAEVADSTGNAGNRTALIR